MKEIQKSRENLWKTYILYSFLHKNEIFQY